ncbi:DUF4124 domain-containing protein [Aquisalimonas sp. 2447]|uniref:DUF4124 domain-containing protein n=1 Tax=Aquisalimonas sp. 2447 TaxID=2740807 RepID=UPI0014324494|nr:DUF4124 domain-containing protein [Aquisalimonas sp. 2447]QIT53749.1 DUF4124 domain-containing protein [Aquisalimonas sp. 2447]
MMIRVLTLLICLAPAALLADVYKHVDEDGNVTYTDEPREGAERLESDEPVSSYQFRAPSRQQPRSAPADDDRDDPSAYARVRIIQPEDEGTVRDNQGYVDVQVALDPNLRDGHRVQFVLDGEPRGELSRSTSQRLTEVHRGEHRLQVRVVDGAGNTVAESDPVTFYMHQASRLMPGSQQGAGPNPGGVPFPGN